MRTPRPVRMPDDILAEVRRLDAEAELARQNPPAEPQLIGQTIKNIRPITKAECNSMGIESWQRTDEIMVLELSNGVKIIPMRDFEMNGGGVLFALQKREAFAIFIEKK